MKINNNFQKLPSSYLFSTITQKVEAFQKTHPDSKLIKLGIGDITLPLAQGIIDALHKAIEEQRNSETFAGYGPERGYEFLRKAILENDFKSRSIELGLDDIFVSDGAKSDTANLQELFSKEVKIAVTDPVYPVYVDSHAMTGRLGDYDTTKNQWSKLTYLPMNEENHFTLEIPKEPVDLIYLCYPNNPTGTVLTKEQLQVWVDYARKNKSVIIFDAAYEAYITEENIPHSIFECAGAKECAIEVRSFSKNAGFTGLRLGYTVVPKELEVDGQSLNQMWRRRQSTKFNGAPYIVQRAGEAVYQEPAASKIKENIQYYLNNAKIIREGLEEVGLQVYGGVNAPYVWLKTPNEVDSWEFFDDLLEKALVVGTPGSGFGSSGEGYFRLTAFNTYEETIEAVERIKEYIKKLV